MSSEAIGTLEITLPKDKVVDFEDYFNEDTPDAFVNAEIAMTKNERAEGREDYRKRQYDICCSHSLLGCLVEDRKKDVKEICDELGVEELEISTTNPYESFSEEITYKNGACSYWGNSYGEKDTKFSIPRQTEMEAE